MTPIFGYLSFLPTNLPSSWSGLIAEGLGCR
jgi:hypothetical protein